MPTEQPSNATDTAIGRDARDDANAAAVLNDDSRDQPPGWGGLGGAAAVGQGAAPGGTSPNSPIDVPLPGAGANAGTPPSADAQARREAVDAAADEQHTASR
jgi:hypothetical protein